MGGGGEGVGAGGVMMMVSVDRRGGMVVVMVKTMLGSFSAGLGVNTGAEIGELGVGNRAVRSGISGAVEGEGTRDKMGGKEVVGWIRGGVVWKTKVGTEGVVCTRGSVTWLAKERDMDAGSDGVEEDTGNSGVRLDCNVETTTLVGRLELPINNVLLKPNTFPATATSAHPTNTPSVLFIGNAKQFDPA